MPRHREDRGRSYDIAQFYPMKATLERLFGHATFLRLKKTGSFADWRRAMRRLLDAIALASRTTVRVADNDWREELDGALSRGREGIALAMGMDELFAAVAATLAEVAFIQIGSMPFRAPGVDAVKLTADWWTLSGFRSVQYVQTDEQRAAVAKLKSRERTASAES